MATPTINVAEENELREVNMSLDQPEDHRPLPPLSNSVYVSTPGSHQVDKGEVKHRRLLAARYNGRVTHLVVRCIELIDEQPELESQFADARDAYEKRIEEKMKPLILKINYLAINDRRNNHFYGFADEICNLQSRLAHYQVARPPAEVLSLVRLLENELQSSIDVSLMKDVLDQMYAHLDFTMGCNWMRELRKKRKETAARAQSGEAGDKVGGKTHEMGAATTASYQG